MRLNPLSAYAKDFANAVSSEGLREVPQKVFLLKRNPIKANQQYSVTHIIISN